MSLNPAEFFPRRGRGEMHPQTAGMTRKVTSRRDFNCDKILAPQAVTTSSRSTGSKSAGLRYDQHPLDSQNNASGMKWSNRLAGRPHSGGSNWEWSLLQVISTYVWDSWSLLWEGHDAFCTEIFHRIAMSVVHVWMRRARGEQSQDPVNLYGRNSQTGTPQIISRTKIQVQ